MASGGTGGERPDADLIRTLEAADYHPLWDRYQKITPIQPKAGDAAKLWRWRDFEPLTARAGAEVPVEDVERRAIIMANPAFGGATVTTANLIAAFTVLEPGDRAVPHRHSASAIRFSTRAEGAATIVNGRRCEMLEGDLILTPAMCWHGHINDSDHRTVWFDAADIPLMNTLDAHFFEPGSREDNAFWQVDEGDERLWQAAGLAAANGPAETAAHSPKFRYPGADARRMLAGLSPGPDGARTLRYVSPATGGAVMNTLDIYMSRLDPGAATRPRRTTWNAVCLVVSGEGRSTVGEETFEWSRHDVFTIPHWEWAHHEATGGEADLFVVTDRAMQESLGLCREEISAE